MEEPDPKLGPDHLHEIVDRTLIVLNNFEEYVQQYPGLEDQFLAPFSEADRISEALASFYQSAASVMDELMRPGED